MADLIERVLPEVIALRRELHANPELSLKEYNTSRRVREMLARIPGLKILPPMMETDVVAVLNADRAGPCLALRADMDALPINEETDVPYKSKVPGVMHACGHDGHTAVLVGTAMVLSQMAEALPGKVKFIFQPAEEDQGGANVLCERGVLESPKVDAAVALHSWPQQPVGYLTIRGGPATAANNEFHVTVRGRGGHGAQPHRCVDPIVASAQIITALQTLVSRSVAPLDSAVVTVGQIAAGTACNVIPNECRMKGTIRYYRPETGKMLQDSVRRIVEGTARALGAEAEVAILPGYPPLVNDVKLARLAESAANDLFGAEHVVTTEEPSMGAEDFAFFAQRVPGMMFRLGIRPENAATAPGLHHPSFNFNDAALPIGIGMFCEIARRFLVGVKE